MAMLFSAIGAQFSILLRLNTMAVDPSAGRRAHYTEGFVRVLMGILSGLIIAVAVKAEIAFGFINSLNEGDPWIVCILCVLAGASERFVPSFLQHMEYGALADMPSTQQLASDERNTQDSTASSQAHNAG